MAMAFGGVKDFFSFLLKFLEEQGISVESILKAYIEEKGGLHAAAQRDLVDALREHGFDKLTQVEVPAGKIVLTNKDVVRPDNLAPTTVVKEGHEPAVEQKPGETIKENPNAAPEVAEPAKTEPKKVEPEPKPVEPPKPADKSASTSTPAPTPHS